jgi:hypothetical protein
VLKRSQIYITAGLRRLKLCYNPIISCEKTLERAVSLLTQL